VHAWNNIAAAATLKSNAPDEYPAGVKHQRMQLLGCGLLIK
jgi:hypothetical protein